MAEDTLPKAPAEGGPVLLDSPVYEMLARKADRGAGGLVITGNVRVTDTRNGRVVYVPFPEASSAQRFKVKTAADSNGVAVCNTWDGTTAGTTDLNVRVAHAAKVGVELWAISVTPNAGVQKDGKDVTLLEVVDGTTASPVTIAAGTSATDATHWSVADDAKPLTITMMTRVVWDATDKIIYGYSRTFKYNSRGLLFEVSAETRSPIDTAVSNCVGVTP